MRQVLVPTIVVLTSLFAFGTSPAWAADDDKSIGGFLVDIAPAPVTAGAIVGLSKSAIVDIQTPKDLTVALNPVTNGTTAPGFGLSFTPARSAIAPMSGQRYVKGGWLARLLGSTSFSYAQGSEDVSGVSQKKTAWALETVAYVDVSDDPIYARATAFHACGEQRRADERDLVKLRVVLAESPVGTDTASTQEKIKTLRTKIAAADPSDCLGMPPGKWNASKFSVSYGQGKIAAGGGPSLSLGKHAIVSGTWGFAEDFALLATVQRIRHAVDRKTLSTTPIYANGSLAAVRLTTQPDRADASLRVMAEISKAKSGSTAAISTALTHALGVDKRVSKDLWFEFRLGRGRSVVNGTPETQSLLVVNWSPGSTLFGK